MQKRSHYRVNYPASARPALLLDGHAYTILDLSETSLKYEHAGNDKPAAGKTVSATIVFADQQTLDVEGSVLRISGTEVIVRLDDGIPFARIMSEQRRFLKLPPDA